MYTKVYVITIVLVFASFIFKIIYEQQRKNTDNKINIICANVAEILSEATIVIVSALIALLLTNWYEKKEEKEQTKAIVHALQQECYDELCNVSDIFSIVGHVTEEKVTKNPNERDYNPFYYISVVEKMDTVIMNDIDSSELLQSEIVINNTDAKLILDKMNIQNRRNKAREDLRRKLAEVENLDYVENYQCSIYLDLYRIACCDADEYNICKNMLNYVDGRTLEHYNSLFYSDSLEKDFELYDIYEPIERYINLCGDVAETSLVNDGYEQERVAIEYYKECYLKEHE